MLNNIVFCFLFEMVLINELIGDFGKYHFWLCFIIFLNKFGIAFHQMAIMFLAPPVNYQCAGGTNLSCCDNPVYNTTVFTRTIVTEWNLICGNSWLKDLNQTLFQFGVLVGSLLFGIASDRFGRRPILIISVIIEVLFGVIASFLPDFWTFTIVRMILGSSVGGIMVVGFVIIMEYAGNNNRDLISALYQVPFAMGHMMLGLIGYFLRDYMYFQLCISVSNVILLFYICLLPETPRWLLAVNKTTEAIAVIERVAKINNLPLDEIERKIELYQLDHKSSTAKRGTVIDLFRTPNLRKNTMVMAFLWLVSSYCYYGVSQYISRLSGDIFMNVVASGGFCFVACFVAIPLMRYMGRKTVVIFANSACGICLLVIAVIPEGIASVVFGCVGVLFSFMVLVVAYLYCSEMFPTVVRNAALGISSMMARLGAMVAPFVAGFGPYGKWCAPVAFGVFPIIAAVLCLLLPETKDCELLMTLEEGEAFGNKLARRRSDVTTSNTAATT